MNMPAIYVVTGQTATGKTDRAIATAIKCGGEIISADARQVYKHLDIVTGKEKQKFKEAGIAVHGLDLCDPRDRYSSYDFVEYARSKIAEIHSRKKAIIIAGGTYLYVKHLLYGFDIAVPPDENLRKDLESKSLEELQDLVGGNHGMNESDFHNPRRLIRKIEILSYRSNFGKKKIPKDLYDITEYIGLRHKNKESLERAIRRRVQERIQSGALNETKKLLEAGYTTDSPGLTGIGYPQLIRYISGDCTLEQATQEWITKELQYAKRQYTFMKKDKNIRWQTL